MTGFNDFPAVTASKILAEIQEREHRVKMLKMSPKERIKHVEDLLVEYPFLLPVEDASKLLASLKSLDELPMIRRNISKEDIEKLYPIDKK